MMAELGETGIGKLELHLYTHRGEDAVVHLFRVAASLDSMVVEPQILGQLKQASSSAGRRLNRTRTQSGC